MIRPKRINANKATTERVWAYNILNLPMPQRPRKPIQGTLYCIITTMVYQTILPNLTITFLDSLRIPKKAGAAVGLEVATSFNIFSSIVDRSQTQFCQAVAEAQKKESANATAPATKAT